MAASSDDRGNERAGGGEAEQEERTDGWMATYSDMVTLLLTFFVLMFALSNVDNERAEMFLAAMSRGGITAEQFLEIRDRYDIDDFDGGEWDDEFPMPAPGEDWDDPGGEDEGETEGERRLRELAAAISEWIVGSGLEDDIAVSFNGDFLMLTLANDVWFDPGQAEVLPDMIDKAQVIAELLAANFTPDDPFEIVIAGHTDNVPMRPGAPYPDNWHLSAARAQNFLRLLIDDSGLEPWHFRMIACGEYRPIGDNNTVEGRQANRRVEVMITRARENPLWDNQFRSE